MVKVSSVYSVYITFLYWPPILPQHLPKNTSESLKETVTDKKDTEDEKCPVTETRQRLRHYQHRFVLDIKKVPTEDKRLKHLDFKKHFHTNYNSFFQAHPALVTMSLYFLKNRASVFGMGLKVCQNTSVKYICANIKIWIWGKYQICCLFRACCSLQCAAHIYIPVRVSEGQIINQIPARGSIVPQDFLCCHVVISYNTICHCGVVFTVTWPHIVKCLHPSWKNKS